MLKCCKPCCNVVKCFIKLLFSIQGEVRKLKGRAFTQEDIGVINHRNAELVAQLRNIDSAFSLGESGNSKSNYFV